MLLFFNILLPHDLLCKADSADQVEPNFRLGQHRDLLNDLSELDFIKLGDRFGSLEYPNQLSQFVEPFTVLIVKVGVKLLLGSQQLSVELLGTNREVRTVKRSL